MGKTRRKRRKFHISNIIHKNKDKEGVSQENKVIQSSNLFLPITPLKDNLFAGVDIDLSNLSKLDQKDRDVQSVKSYKSAKSEATNQILPKREKLRLRRDILLKKIDTVNQMKKELKIREKRKNVAIIGDTNLLHDALPSLDSLLKNRSDIIFKKNNGNPIKKRGTEKAKKRKKELMQGVKMLKNVWKSETFQKNPFEVITQHVKAVVLKNSNLPKSKN